MASPHPLTRRLVTFVGRVQGVGFRWFVKESADALGLSGWVRNRDDGSVELEVEGSTDSLDELERRLRTGNPAAIVDKILTVPLAPRGGNGFEIRRG
ncbi:MAG TPA: acylphosphatase [Elusimicrobiota bacterium]|nr:acylphosphatase [Elusimicrobiota bacterium]